MTKVTHDISTSGWTTSLESVMRININKKKKGNLYYKPKYIAISRDVLDDFKMNPNNIDAVYKGTGWFSLFRDVAARLRVLKVPSVEAIATHAPGASSGPGPDAERKAFFAKGQSISVFVFTAAKNKKIKYGIEAGGTNIDRYFSGTYGTIRSYWDNKFVDPSSFE